MKNIEELNILSKKLIDSIGFIPIDAVILSNQWKDRKQDLLIIDHQLCNYSVKHEFYVSKSSEEKLYIFWDHELIDKDLKDFFKILVRILKFSGTKNILALDQCISLTGMNNKFVAIRDHINFTSDNPLIGKNFEEIGTRFPDMSQAYSEKYTDEFKDIRKVVLAGVDDNDVSEKTMDLIKISDAEVFNFSVFWMNVLAVHSSIEFSAVCKVEKPQ